MSNTGMRNTVMKNMMTSMEENTILNAIRKVRNAKMTMIRSATKSMMSVMTMTMNMTKKWKNSQMRTLTPTHST